MEAMQSTRLTLDESEKLRQQLREAHAENSATYVCLKDYPSEGQLRNRNVNRLIDHGLYFIWRRTIRICYRQSKSQHDIQPVHMLSVCSTLLAINL